MKFTTLDKLARRLRGRLKLGDSYPSEQSIDNPLDSLISYKPSASEQTVDLLLVTDIADTTDAYIELLLSQVYKVPLKLSSEITRGILANVSEGLILSNLIATHFTGTPGIVASDTSQASMDFRRNSEFLLSQLLAGTGVFFPQTLQPAPSQVNVPQQTPLYLPEEVRLGQSERPDLISRNYTFNAVRKNGGNNPFDSTDCPVRKDGTAYGSTPNGYCINDNTYKGFEKFG